MNFTGKVVEVEVNTQPFVFKTGIRECVCNAFTTIGKILKADKEVMVLSSYDNEDIKVIKIEDINYMEDYRTKEVYI